MLLTLGNNKSSVEDLKDLRAPSTESLTKESRLLSNVVVKFPKVDARANGRVGIGDELDLPEAFAVELLRRPVAGSSSAMREDRKGRSRCRPVVVARTI